MREQQWQTDCPTCGREVRRSSSRKAPFFPFCSERCKLIDLGKWFDEEHRISDPSTGDGQTSSGEDTA